MSPIIIAIIAIICVFIFFKLLRSILKALFAALGVILIIVLIFGIIAYSDVKQANHALQEENKVFLYTHKGEIISGVSIINGSEMGFYQNGSLREGMSSISTQDYQNLIEGKRTTNDEFIIAADHDWVWEELQSISAFGRQYNKEEFYEAITTSNTNSETSAPSTQVQSALTLVAITQTLKSGGAEHLVTGLHQEELIINPPLTSVTILRLIPSDVLKSALDKSLALDIRGEKE